MAPDTAHHSAKLYGSRRRHQPPVNRYVCGGNRRRSGERLLARDSIPISTVTIMVTAARALLNAQAPSLSQDGLRRTARPMTGTDKNGAPGCSRDQVGTGSRHISTSATAPDRERSCMARSPIQEPRSLTETSQPSPQHVGRGASSHPWSLLNMSWTAPLQNTRSHAL